MISSWFNRSDLRKYAEKIKDRSISFEELKDYIAKRGNIHHFQSYDSVQNFFVGSQKVPVLNYFVIGKEPDPRADRLQSLELLLKNGASPNTQSDVTMQLEGLASVLYASYNGDTKAFELFLQNGADLNLQEEKYAGLYGPPLAVAQNSQIADLIIKAGYDIQSKDAKGRSLLDLLLQSALSGDRILERLQWMKSKGFPFASDSKELAAARKKAQGTLSLFQDKNSNPEQTQAWAQIVKLLE